MTPQPASQLRFFDFLRGWAALLVFLHHAALLGNGPALLSDGRVGEQAVNAFMFASGFLIYYQSAINASYGGFASMGGTCNFYIRRFFRIAPVYYVALALAFMAGTQLGEARQAIAAFAPQTRTDLSRYFMADPLGNALMHVSFLFGLFPRFAFSTPLPDWSLGLEMQFYLVFPVIFLALRKRFLPMMFVLLLTALAVRLGLKLEGIAYPMPSFLPLKFHNFAAGMAIAYLHLNPTVRRWPLLALILSSVGVGERSLWMPAIVLICHSLLHQPESGHARLDALFGHWTSRWLADLSYSVYILHLLVVLPVFAWAVPFTSVSMTDWWAVSLATLGVVLILSWAVMHWVEAPGIQIGKRLLRRPSLPQAIRLAK
ncbi:MAG: acyltransferase family protein [Rhizobacter sp.]